MRRDDASGNVDRNALAGALVGLAVGIALPLLPIYGDGHQFVWTGFPARFVAAYLVNAWASSLAVLLGIVVLLRRRSRTAAGVFGAVAIIVAARIVARFIPGSIDLGPWQIVLDLSLEAIEAIALVIAASLAIRAPA